MKYEKEKPVWKGGFFIDITYHLSEKVLLKLKAKAIDTGIPYQTLASSILHQFVMRDSK